ncbi:hypothetical protein QJS10_CPA08g00199 [Acorus calamus]|uniref:Uncharacterized protein n=1 Tax=Acorus calamus TaxID=4465 RepID=A0AAV9EAY7_ACOCL|nr:hypothetical protein QJS10_CPA08g00199 [Acorus calamus]
MRRSTLRQRSPLRPPMLRCPSPWPPLDGPLVRPRRGPSDRGSIASNGRRESHPTVRCDRPVIDGP